MEKDKDFLSIQNTKCLKGILAIMVLIYHLYLSLNIDLGCFNVLFKPMGYLAVSVFFFISGFGLMSSLKMRGGILNHL